MSKNTKIIKPKIDEFQKLNSMKEKLINSKTLNISLINKNILKSHNSEKNPFKKSEKTDIKFITKDSNTIIMDPKNIHENFLNIFKNNYEIENQDEIKESDIKINVSLEKTSKINENENPPIESDTQRYLIYLK